MADDTGLYEMIGKQALLLKLRDEEIADLKERLHKIYSNLICCGGPLNDNYHRYTNNQLTIFFVIKDLADIGED